MNITHGNWMSKVENWFTPAVLGIWVSSKDYHCSGIRKANLYFDFLVFMLSRSVPQILQPETARNLEFFRKLSCSGGPCISLHTGLLQRQKFQFWFFSFSAVTSALGCNAIAGMFCYSVKSSLVRETRIPLCTGVQSILQSVKIAFATLWFLFYSCWIHKSLQIYERKVVALQRRTECHR